MRVCGREDGVNLYVVGIFHTRSLLLNRVKHFDVSSPPCSLHPTNLLHVAPLCAPVIRCNEKCFKMTLTYHAMLIERALDTATRGKQSSLTDEGTEEKGKRKEEGVVFSAISGWQKVK